MPASYVAFSDVSSGAYRATWGRVTVRFALQVNDVNMVSHSRGRRPGRTASDDREAIGSRLRQLRLAAAPGLTIKEYADKFGFSRSTYAMWETGQSLLGPMEAVALCAEYGVTLDWVFRGDRGSLNQAARDLLDHGQTRNNSRHG